MKIAIYPGSFDPITNGHVDIIRRCAKIFDKVYILVANNASKKTLFSVTERMNLIKESLSDLNNIEVVTSDLLTVDFAKSVKAKVIVRGLRNEFDFDYEAQLAKYNKYISNEIETMFLLSDSKYDFISSSGIKELFEYSQDITPFVPKVVKEALEKKLK